MSEFGPSFPEHSEGLKDDVRENTSPETSLVSRKSFLQKVRAGQWPRAKDEAEKLSVITRLAELAGGKVMHVAETPGVTKQQGVLARSEHFEHYHVMLFETSRGQLYVCSATDTNYRYDLYEKGVRIDGQIYGTRKDLVEAIAYLLE